MGQEGVSNVLTRYSNFKNLTKLADTSDFLVRVPNIANSLKSALPIDNYSLFIVDISTSPGIGYYTGHVGKWHLGAMTAQGIVNLYI